MKYFVALILILSVNTGISKEQSLEINYIPEVDSVEQAEIKLESFNNKILELNCFIDEKVNNI